MHFLGNMNKIISQALHRMSTHNAFYVLITQRVNSVGLVLMEARHSTDLVEACFTMQWALSNKPVDAALLDSAIKAFCSSVWFPVHVVTRSNALV